MSRKKKTELRIFKLRSGEEIIAKVAGKTKDKIKLQRPMRIMNNIQSDPYTGAKRQVIYFSDWLGSTSEIIADIPLDFIVVELQPDPDIVCLYDRQTEADDPDGGERRGGHLVSTRSRPRQLLEDRCAAKGFAAGYELADRHALALHLGHEFAHFP